MISIEQFVKINKQASNWLMVSFPQYFSGGDYKTALLDVLNSNLNKNEKLLSVLEVGGIDRPLLQKQKSIIYDGLDIEVKPACHDIYNNFLVQSVESKITKKYEIVVSTTLLEHVRDNAAAMCSIDLTPKYVPDSN